MSLTATLVGGDGATFLRAWLSDPLGIAAIAPSGAAFAALITSRIGPETGSVIELGPGTGVFTRALLGRGVEPRQLLMIEQSPAFTLLLRRRFPGTDVVCSRAGDLARHARARLAEAPGGYRVGPALLAMSAASAMRILYAARTVLRWGEPGRSHGAFYQFHLRPRPTLAKRGGATAVLGDDLHRQDSLEPAPGIAV